MTASFLDSARAIESLRTGVPNGTAVRLLGCSQPRVSRKFDLALDKVERGEAIDGQVALGCFLREKPLLGFPDDAEQRYAAGFVLINSNAKVDFVRVAVSVESLR